jgi:hypothetical protein
MRLSVKLTIGFADPRGDETAFDTGQEHSRSLHFATRSGRDDNFVRVIASSTNELSSRPERSVVEGPAVESCVEVVPSPATRIGLVSSQKGASNSPKPPKPQENPGQSPGPWEGLSSIRSLEECRKIRLPEDLPRLPRLPLTFLRFVGAAAASGAQRNAEKLACPSTYHAYHAYHSRFCVLREPSATFGAPE